MKIHVKRDGQDFGPYSPEEAQSHFTNGTILPTDLVWHEELPNWISASELLASLNEPSLPPTLAPTTPSESPKILGMKKKYFFAASGCLVLLIGFLGLVVLTLLVDESSPIPDYQVVSSKNFDYAKYKRKDFKIRVDKTLEASELQLIAEEVLEKSRSEEEVDAAMFDFYLPDTGVDGPYTAGRVIWGRDGKWETLDSNLPHSFTVITGGIYDDSLPSKQANRFTSQQRRTIFETIIKAERRARKEAETLFPNNLDMEQEAFGLKNEKYKSEIVADKNLTKEELSAIINEGIRKNW
jgi:hypothetical protein